MALKSSFWQNYRTTFLPTVPPSAARISRVVADMKAPGDESGNANTRGKAMASYPYELAQDAAYQSHTSRLTEFWSLPKGWIPLTLSVLMLQNGSVSSTAKVDNVSERIHYADLCLATLISVLCLFSAQCLNTESILKGSCVIYCL